MATCDFARIKLHRITYTFSHQTKSAIAASSILETKTNMYYFRCQTYFTTITKILDLVDNIIPSYPTLPKLLKLYVSYI